LLVGAVARKVPGVRLQDAVEQDGLTLAGRQAPEAGE